MHALLPILGISLKHLFLLWFVLADPITACVVQTLTLSKADQPAAISLLPSCTVHLLTLKFMTLANSCVIRGGVEELLFHRYY